MALSKDWQLLNVRGILRILANELAEDKIQDLTINDFVHLAICDLAELLGESQYNDYGVRQTVTQTADVIDISTYEIDTITKLVDVTLGLVVEVNNIEFEGLAGIPQKQANIFWTKFGANIYLYKGTSAGSYGVLNLFYNRTPIKATADVDYLDIKDKFVKLVIDKAKILMYEHINQTPPEALTQSVNNSIAQIRKANQEELQVVKSSKSKNN